MLFRISKSGSDYQVVLQEAPYSLSVASDGNFYGSDGNFYGTCYSSWWHVCRVSTSGQDPIFEYPTGTDGRPPANGILTQGSDGVLYSVVLI